MKHYLFRSEMEGEFLVGADSFEEAIDILQANDLYNDVIGNGYDILTDWQAECCGLDEL
jgi:hypothetical protein